MQASKVAKRPSADTSSASSTLEEEEPVSRKRAPNPLSMKKRQIKVANPVYFFLVSKENVQRAAEHPKVTRRSKKKRKLNSGLAQSVPNQEVAEA